MKKIVVFLFLPLLLLSCQKEEINQITVPNYGQDGKYILEPVPGLLGNVKITIWPAFNADEAKILVENRLDIPIGYIIRDLDDLSFAYFIDSYIPGKGDSEKYGTKIPLNETVYIKLIAYNSTLSYGLIQAIEGLGLDFWQSISDYRDNLRQEYEGQLILEP
ncbi:MAG: hypothetical protein K9M44_05050 [Candidatus Pacebacteria bacterium]|nr:hypothetical protein [Candidatus Paceibacterota bacterium]